MHILHPSVSQASLANTDVWRGFSSFKNKCLLGTVSQSSNVLGNTCHKLSNFFPEPI